MFVNIAGSLFEKCRPKSNHQTELDMSTEKLDSASSGREDILSHHSSRNGASPVRSRQSPESGTTASSECTKDSSNPFLDSDYISLTNPFVGTSERSPSPERSEGGGENLHNGERRETSPKKEKKKRKKRETTPTGDAGVRMEPQSSSTPEKKLEANGWVIPCLMFHLNVLYRNKE